MILSIHFRFSLLYIYSSSCKYGKVTAVSNGTISGSKDSTSNDKAKGLVVKELSVKNIDDKVKAEQQVIVTRPAITYFPCNAMNQYSMHAHVSQPAEDNVSSFYLLLLQTTMGNYTLGDGLAMVNEVSVMEMDHTTDAVGQVLSHWLCPFYFGLFVWSRVHVVAHLASGVSCIHCCSIHGKKESLSLVYLCAYFIK